MFLQDLRSNSCSAPASDHPISGTAARAAPGDHGSEPLRVERVLENGDDIIPLFSKVRQLPVCCLGELHREYGPFLEDVGDVRDCGSLGGSEVKSVPLHLKVDLGLLYQRCKFGPPGDPFPVDPPVDRQKSLAVNRGAVPSIQCIELSVLGSQPHRWDHGEGQVRNG